MPNPPAILLCASALDGTGSSKSLEMLRQVTLPNATKFILTSGKFETEKAAKTFNVESGYPAEPSYLQTLSVWAEVGASADPRFRDGYDFYGLRGIIEGESGFDYAILLRDDCGFQDRWTELRANVDDRLFLMFGVQSSANAQPNVVFNLGHKNSSRFLEFISDLFVTGAAYGLSPYSPHAALSAAADGLLIEDELEAMDVTS